MLGVKESPNGSFTDEETRLIAPSSVGSDPRVNRIWEEYRSRAMIKEGFDPKRARTAGYVVSERADGSLIWLDGQHRARAAIWSDLGDEPVKMTVLSGLTLEEEAEWVLLFSEGRKRTTPAEAHRIGVRSRRPLDTLLHAVCADCGVIADGGKSAGHLRSVGTARKEVATDPEAFHKGLKALTAAYGHASSALDAPLLSGASWFFRVHPDLSTDEVARKMQLLEHHRLVARGKGNREQNGGSLGLNVARAIVGLYNSKKRSGALPPL